jgi:hypothetical protein
VGALFRDAGRIRINRVYFHRVTPVIEESGSILVSGLGFRV